MHCVGIPENNGTRGYGCGGACHDDHIPPRNAGSHNGDPEEDTVDYEICPRIQENGDENTHEGAGNPIANPVSDFGMEGMDGEARDILESKRETRSTHSHRTGDIDQATENVDDV